ncbi:hypothetical protein ANCCAN_08818 [Ancylostoma caninum]|uniref:Alpha-D-phosphohexomutase alpha/beta/alpha domain-containing protein n=1 Tax=Ancylostoma caninum TaxID=29170 RepID=A0A368GLH3_ANCCA|nr:hypothetical protein ANCCAN_08818 [Ancylostoma caninum]
MFFFIFWQASNRLWSFTRFSGLLTTPQLHYIVKCKNDPSYGEAKEIGYYVRISDAFKELLKVQGEPRESSYSREIILDCANGVGAEKMRMMCRFLPEDALKIQFRNEYGVLNYKVRYSICRRP